MFFYMENQDLQSTDFVDNILLIYDTEYRNTLVFN